MLSKLTYTSAAEDKWVQINGLDIHYLDWGGGGKPVLLLVHGQGGNAHNWDHIAKNLRNDFWIIAIDQRGHGDSEHTHEGYAAKAFASELATFANTIGLPPYDYCGASLGARNGIAYAGEYSHHLKHLVCLDYGPEMSVQSARNQIKTMNQRQTRGWISIDEYVKEQRQAGAKGNEEHLRHQAEYSLRLNYAGKYVLKADPELFWINGSFGAREVPYLWEQWAKTQCPILELKGALSNYLSPETLDRMKQEQPRMQLVEVPNSGHAITTENPEFLVDQLRSFLVA